MRDFGVFLNGKLVTVIGVSRYPASLAYETARRTAELFRTTPQDLITVK